MNAFNPPSEHQVFLKRALTFFQQDTRFVGLAAAGSWITQSMDEFSDLDLIAVVDPPYYKSVIAERFQIVDRLGYLLAAFSGEHIGEPRVLICLFDESKLHVDVKFVMPDDLLVRIENPVVLWERASALSQVISQSEPKHPMPDLQWIEDRFWIWIHYAAQRLGRGELYEVIDFLSYLRSQVLGPLALVAEGQLPRGVRRLETLAKPWLPDFIKTIPQYSSEACAKAIEATVSLYLKLRDHARKGEFNRRAQAEIAAMAYLRRITAKLTTVGKVTF